MIRVLKYPLPINDLVVLNLPEGAEILRIACKAGEPMLWARVDTEADPEYRVFQVHGTGVDVVPIPLGDWDEILPADVDLQHVASFEHRQFVLHVFERVLRGSVAPFRMAR